MGQDEGVDPLARALFVLLILACFAAFFITQRLKHTPTVVQRFEHSPVFSPRGPGRSRLERISFKLASADEVTVTILDSSRNTVATLVQNYPVPRYKQFSLRWNGRRGTAHRYLQVISTTGHHSLLPVNEGAIAPVGVYRVRVQLRRQNRAVVSPWTFSLEGP